MEFVDKVLQTKYNFDVRAMLMVEVTMYWNWDGIMLFRCLRIYGQVYF